MKRKRAAMCPSDQEAQSQEQKTKVEIFVKENEPNCGRRRYRWAWKESAEKKVFGCAATIEEIKRRSARMFPDSEIVLLYL